MHGYEIYKALDLILIDNHDDFKEQKALYRRDAIKK